MMTGEADQAHTLSLAEMAAASVGEHQDGNLGTAVYLLASMFNHSCSPNVDVTYPLNNSKLLWLLDLLPGLLPKR